MLHHRVYESREICILEINYAGLCMSTHTHTHIHVHTHTHAHKHTCVRARTLLPKFFLCSSWGPSCSDVIACCHFADWDLLKAEHFDSYSRVLTVHGRADIHVTQTLKQNDACIMHIRTYMVHNVSAPIKRMSGGQKKGCAPDDLIQKERENKR